MANNVCGDCGCKEGELHELGCDIEVCQFCGGQLISCVCQDKKFGEGRIPYIHWPVRCARCGTTWPDLFMVSDADWKHYIQPNKRGGIVCLPCYREIKHLIDTAAAARGENLPPVDPANPDRLTITPEEHHRRLLALISGTATKTSRRHD